MKIYFAGSIRAGRADRELYLSIIAHLQKYGHVLTEHVGDQSITSSGDQGPEEQIYQRDLSWLMSSDVIIAEVTTPSLGVGYELGKAEAAGKKVLCLFRPNENKKLSAMIAGNKSVVIKTYMTLPEALKIIDDFFKSQ